MNLWTEILVPLFKSMKMENCWDILMTGTQMSQSNLMAVWRRSRWFTHRRRSPLRARPQIDAKVQGQKRKSRQRGTRYRPKNVWLTGTGPAAGPPGRKLSPTPDFFRWFIWKNPLPQFYSVYNSQHISISSSSPSPPSLWTLLRLDGEPEKSKSAGNRFSDAVEGRKHRLFRSLKVNDRFLFAFLTFVIVHHFVFSLRG